MSRKTVKVTWARRLRTAGNRPVDITLNYNGRAQRSLTLGEMEAKELRDQLNKKFPVVPEKVAEVHAPLLCAVKYDAEGRAMIPCGYRKTRASDTYARGVLSAWRTKGKADVHHGGQDFWKPTLRLLSDSDVVRITKA